jgi:hypothetical protein
MAAPDKQLPCPRMVRGQQELTSEQEAYARQFAEERIAAMFSTAAVDEQEAKEHLWNAYRVLGLKPPHMRWFDSPVPFVEEYSSTLKYSREERAWKGVWDSALSLARDSVRNSVEESMWKGVEISVRDSIRRHVWEITNMGYSVWESVEESVRGWVGVSVGYHVWYSVQAYADEDWQALYRFFHKIFEANKLIHLALFNEMVSGYYLGKQEAWLVRKPVRFERDEQGRLHSPDGMCLQYRDGWGFYAWHGVHIPEKLILHPEEVTKEDWFSESNLEVRRALEERLGNDRFVELVGGSCIDKGERGELIVVDLGNDPERVAHYVHVQDTSTERQYYLRVPPSIRHADEAVAWTFGLNEQDYRPVQEA